jgi:hypothetical protein
LYLQARGSNAADPTVDAWNQASRTHLSRADSFEREFSEWTDRLKQSEDVRVNVEAVGFRGKRRIWRRGGNTVEQPRLLRATPSQALEFLKNNREQLWRFRSVKENEEIEEEAKQVRKPAVAVLTSLDAMAFRACNGDSLAIQQLLHSELKTVVRKMAEG